MGKKLLANFIVRVLLSCKTPDHEKTFYAWFDRMKLDDETKALCLAESERLLLLNEARADAQV